MIYSNITPTQLEKFNKAVTYINTYGQYHGECMGCGEFLHEGVICFNCGLDPTDEDTFHTWMVNELKRKES